MSSISSFSNANLYISPTPIDSATSSETSNTTSSPTTTSSADSSSAYSLSDNLSALINSLSTPATASSSSSTSTDSIYSSPAYLLSDSLSTLINSLSTSSKPSPSSSSNSFLNDLYSSAITMSYVNSLTPTEFQYMQNMNTSTDDTYSTKKYQNTSNELSVLLDGTNKSLSSNTASTLLSTLFG